MSEIGEAAKPVWRKFIKIFGYLVTFFSLYYIVRTVLAMDVGKLDIEATALILSCIFLLVFFYAIAFLGLSYAWYRLLTALGGERGCLTFRSAMRIYAQANLMKYLPGNIMGFVGRNLMAKKFGFSHSEIAASSVLEAGFVIVISVSIALLLTWNRTLVIVGANYLPDIAWLLLVLATLSVGIFVLPRLLRLMSLPPLSFFLKKSFLQVSLIVLGIRFAVFLSFGTILALIYSWVLQVELAQSDYFAIIGAFTLSWAIGFITPGASGGLGVREALLLIFLSNSLGREVTLAAAVLYRLISIVGDLVAFPIAVGLEKNWMLQRAGEKS